MKLNATETPKLTYRFEQALVYANRLHAKQTRKGGNVPYISHLLSVAALVLEDGGDEDEAISALLHDAVEDQGGKATREVISNIFGEKVIEIVDGCTDSDTIPKPPWQERKQQYIEKLRCASASVRRVALADKLHNARCILSDLHGEGEATWEKFRGGKEGTLWYYRTLSKLFVETDANSWLVEELNRIVSEFK
ncbi:MAG: HD domain-containing protein [Cyanomargarita calcarea GSE-NOS-MK-12-04C]|jgi:(p)ppGpp synthase/HD superfamily hydrolase|uniref:HD domain-containing protein n=1 Tax=Cyanomargarita calcarea GSE-NOS-MK-12-04C TaxID=2839659 RepID=A0A951QL26_9CYAN|nr:HD domain-containing protein [Cyanomargarita calcarea GSE-NOS-MK-12-04C]